MNLLLSWPGLGLCPAAAAMGREGQMVRAAREPWCLSWLGSDCRQSTCLAKQGSTAAGKQDETSARFVMFVQSHGGPRGYGEDRHELAVGTQLSCQLAAHQDHGHCHVSAPWKPPCEQRVGLVDLGYAQVGRKHPQNRICPSQGMLNCHQRWHLLVGPVQVGRGIGRCEP